MGTGATDSRHLRQIGTVSCGRAAHGDDERRPIQWIGEGLVSSPR